MGWNFINNCQFTVGSSAPVKPFSPMLAMKMGVIKQRSIIAMDCRPGEGFHEFSSMKLPDTENVVFSSNISQLDCEAACKNNCLCTAYANPNITSGRVGCLLWFGGLIDVECTHKMGKIFMLDLPPQNYQLPWKETTSYGSDFVNISCSYFGGLHIGTLHHTEKMEEEVRCRDSRPTETLDEDYKGINRHMRTAEVPLFSLAEISKATNDFSINKLGQGGFGPVYKGVPEQGQEIAVKRLSKSFRQGLDEFENEVI
ncbi:putative non-specific serine/threonine protein kinase [Helianthus annuus]|nr:putative non-specific serine/threonine protein kinase [Helianthus annuus]